MKFFKSILAALALFGMAMAGSVAQAEPSKLGDQLYVVSSVNNTLVIASSAIERNGNYVENWSFAAVPMKNKIFNALVRYDCVSRTATLLKLETYDYEGNILGFTEPNETVSAVEGSNYGQIYKAACGYAVVEQLGFKPLNNSEFGSIILAFRKYVLSKAS